MRSSRSRTSARRPRRSPTSRASHPSSEDSAAVRCVRIWTAADARSRFEEGTIALAPGEHGDLASERFHVGTASFSQTPPGGKREWHTAPVRQLVVTLAGTLEFETRDGEFFTLRPGDVLLAEDTVGHGHSWRLTDDEPWRRLYVVLDAGAAVPFLAASPTP